MTVEYRTVLIGADCTARFEGAVESGVELARVLQLGLAGLFIEEDELIDFSALPFTTVVQTGRGGARPLDAVAMRRALARESARLRAELERRAREFDLRWRFEVGRGRTREALGRAAQAGDIVVLPTARGEAALRARLEVAEALLARGHAALLAPDRARPPGGAVLALIEAPGGEAALALAARIAARLETRLVIRAWPRGGEAGADFDALARRLTEEARAAGGPEAIEATAAPEGEALDAAALEEAAPRLIVARWPLGGGLDLAGPRSPLRRRGAGLLLLPGEDR